MTSTVSEGESNEREREREKDKWRDNILGTYLLSRSVKNTSSGGTATGGWLGVDTIITVDAIFLTSISIIHCHPYHYCCYHNRISLQSSRIHQKTKVVYAVIAIINIITAILLLIITIITAG